MSDRDFWTAVFLECYKDMRWSDHAIAEANEAVEARNKIGAEADRRALAAHWNG